MAIFSHIFYRTPEGTVGTKAKRTTSSATQRDKQMVTVHVNIILHDENVY